MQVSVQNITCFSRCIFDANENEPGFSTLSIETTGGRAAVFYDNEEQIQAHIDALSGLLKEWQEKTNQDKGEA